MNDLIRTLGPLPNLILWNKYVKGNRALNKEKKKRNPNVFYFLFIFFLINDL